MTRSAITELSVPTTVTSERDGVRKGTKWERLLVTKTEAPSGERLTPHAPRPADSLLTSRLCCRSTTEMSAEPALAT
jgi:hypothetical protein